MTTEYVGIPSHWHRVPTHEVPRDPSSHAVLRYGKQGKPPAFRSHCARNPIPICALFQADVFNLLRRREPGCAAKGSSTASVDSTFSLFGPFQTLECHSSDSCCGGHCAEKECCHAISCELHAGARNRIWEIYRGSEEMHFSQKGVQ